MVPPSNTVVDILIPRVPTGGRFPKLTTDVSLVPGSRVTVEEKSGAHPDAQLDIEQFGFVNSVNPSTPLPSGTVRVKGILKLWGNGPQKALFVNTIIIPEADSTVEYYTASATMLPLSIADIYPGPYANLIVDRIIATPAGTPIQIDARMQTYKKKVILGRTITFKADAPTSSVSFEDEIVASNQDIVFNTPSATVKKIAARNVSCERLGSTFEVQEPAALSGNLKVRNLSVRTAALGAAEITVNETTTVHSAATITAPTQTYNGAVTLNANTIFNASDSLTFDTNAVINASGKTVTLNSSSAGKTITMSGAITAAVLNAHVSEKLILKGAVKLSNKFEQTGGAAVQIGAPITDHAGTGLPLNGIFFASKNLYLVVTPPAATTFDPSPAAVNKPDDCNIFVAGNLALNNELKCANFVLFKGTVTLGASGGITTSGDIVLFGSGYKADDTTAPDHSGIAGLFTYKHSDRTGAAPSVTLPTELPDGTSLPKETDSSPSFSGAFAHLNGKTLKAGKNFYANGMNLSASGAWTLTIPDNDNATAAFAEAYFTTVSHCAAAGGWVAAAEKCTDGGNNTNWDFTRPTIVQAYTVSDDTIYVEFSEPIENTNNEISAVPVHIKYDNNSKPFNQMVPVGTDGKKFRLKTMGTKWNTDATGTSAGNADSTDRSGAHQNVKVDLTVPKALSGVYATLRDEHKNRIKHYSAANTFTAVADHCPPVLIGVYTGQEQHFQSTSQPHYDAHNFIEFHYSEPVALDAADSIADNAENVAATAALGRFSAGSDTNPPASGYALRIAGLADITTGSVTAHFRGTAPSGAVQPHALYRKFPDAAAAVPATSPTESNHSCRVRISIAGLTNGAVPRGGFTVKNWVGYITGAVQCAGTVQPLAGVRDKAATPNPLDTSHTVTVSATSGSLYGDWDTSPPVFAKFSTESGNWTNPANKKKEIAPFSSSNLADKIEFHFFDNTPDYTSSAQWWESAGPGNPNPKWNGIAGATGSYDAYGGSRFTGTNRTTGGIRACSLPEPADVINCFKFTGDAIQPALNSFYAPQAVFQKAENGALFGQPSGGWANFDNLYLQLKIASSPSSFSVQMGFKVDYIACISPTSTHSGGFITDLAGNLMVSSPDNDTAIASPPTIALTVAPVGSNKMFILFSIPIKTTRETLRKIPDNLQLIGDPSLQIDTSKPAVVRIDTENATGIIVTLTRNVTYNDIRPMPRSSPPLPPGTRPIVIEITGNPIHIKPREDNGLPAFAGHKHVLSDFAVNVVHPQFAYDEKKLPDGSVGFLKKGLYGGDSQAVRLFDGSGAPGNTVFAQTDVTLNVAVDVPSAMPAHGNFKMFIANSPDSASVSAEFNRVTGLQSRVWLPHITKWPPPVIPAVTDVRAISPQSNTACTHIPSESGSPPRNPYVFKLNLTQSPLNYAAGTTAGFLFPMVDTAGNYIIIDHDMDGNNHIPLYALRLKDPNDPASIDLWSLDIGAIKEQAGGVSILNNVINTSSGENTFIEVKTGSRGSLNVVVMSLDGDVIRVLHSGRTEAGTHLFKWNGTNKRGDEVARGLYFIRVTGPGIDETRKVMAVRE